MASSRITDARNEVKRGDDALKTGMFKWSKDYDTAARAYEAAGTKFLSASCIDEGAGTLDDAKTNFVRASQCKMKSATPSPFFAAKLLEQACACTERQAEAEAEGSPRAIQLAKEGAGYMLEANILYQQNGNFERAMEAIQKAAKVCERDAPEQALKNYVDLGTVTVHLERAGKVLAIDALREGIQFAVRNKSYTEALRILDTFVAFTEELEQTLDLKKACLSIIILHLANGDGSGAEAAVNRLCRDAPSFGSTEEYSLALEILAAFADRDNDALMACKKNDRVKALDHTMIRLIAGLRVDAAQINGSFSNTGADLCAGGDDDGEPDLSGSKVQQQDEDTDLC